VEEITLASLLVDVIFSRKKKTSKKSFDFGGSPDHSGDHQQSS